MVEIQKMADSSHSETNGSEHFLYESCDSNDVSGAYDSSDTCSASDLLKRKKINSGGDINELMAKRKRNTDLNLFTDESDCCPEYESSDNDSNCGRLSTSRQISCRRSVRRRRSIVIEQRPSVDCQFFHSHRNSSTSKRHAEKRCIFPPSASASSSQNFASSGRSNPISHQHNNAQHSDQVQNARRDLWPPIHTSLDGYPKDEIPESTAAPLLVSARFHQDLPLEWWERSEECRVAKSLHMERVDSLCCSREHLVMLTTLWNADIKLEENMFPCEW